ncbi:uncharacterized protein LOC131258549 [Anopheles coustani]|uniref:uncharacterized protein LOC131258549 n=1 Tax=Anopheles coustani TaxID=139045 RepID=UPI0026589EEB|nr:uncharacterized protein LOC131258549 [Anopheles coustani]
MFRKSSHHPERSGRSGNIYVHSSTVAGQGSRSGRSAGSPFDVGLVLSPSPPLSLRSPSSSVNQSPPGERNWSSQLASSGPNRRCHRPHAPPTNKLSNSGTISKGFAANENTKRATIIIYPTVSPETVIIPIVSCIIGFPILALLVICCLRRRAKLARERDRRRNIDLQDHAVSLITMPRELSVCVLREV